jgi:Sulfotransferase domain
LIFSVDQGWAPLCAFLGVPQPAGNFPDVNHRAEFKKTVGDVIKGMYVTVAAYAAGALALLYGAYRFLL